MTISNKMEVTYFTLFPQMFPASLGYSLAGKALKSNIWSYNTVDIRKYADNKHNNVDDKPYGGGAGMVMRPDVLDNSLQDNVKDDSKIIYMSPRGVLLNQSKVSELSKLKKISIICGRFEGVDQRIIDKYNIEEISIGDYILSGGEIAACALTDAILRLIPGVIGNAETLNEESFGDNADYAGLLEYPLYTKPLRFKNMCVPEVLTSGNHKKIKQWRLEQAEKITSNRRPDLWKKYKKIED